MLQPRLYNTSIVFNFFTYRLHHSSKASAEIMEVLSTKKCVPCNTKDLRPMTEQAANQLMPQVSGLNLVNDGGTLKLHRSWKVKTFTRGLEFFQEVANVAEAEGHHPDLHLVGWNNVKINIWTHSVGGLTENDFILAAKINGLDVQHLLSKKLSGPALNLPSSGLYYDVSFPQTRYHGRLSTFITKELKSSGHRLSEGHFVHSISYH